MVHIIQNDPEVPPGTIAEYLDAFGVVYVVHHPYCGDPLPELRDVSALIVLGGAMGANDDAWHPFLCGLKEFIRQAVTTGIPYLGVCLGGQLLAATFDAPVESNRWEELGNLPVEVQPAGQNDPLFEGLSRRFVTFQWHHDSFDIPAGGELLASSPVCPHQAFRIGPCAWGVQFHPEVTEQIIRDWCAWDQTTPERIGELLDGYRSFEPEYRATAQRILQNFLTVAGLRPEAD